MTDENGLAHERLGEVAELLMGNSPPGDTYNDQSKGLPLINGPAEYGPRHPQPVKWTTAPNRICKPGDVLVCVRGNTTGRLCIADREYCIGRGVAALRGREGRFATPFLEFVLLHQQDRILELATGGGSTFPNINKPQLEELAVPVPDLDEQQAIAHVLRTVQQAKEATEKTLAAARHLKASLMRHLFTYGPVPVREADRVALKETELGLVPVHWEVKPIGTVADLASGGTPSKHRPEFWSGPIPWVSPKDMKQPRLFDAQDHISEQAVKEGSRIAPVGSVFLVVRGMILAKDLPVALAMVPMAFNQDMKAIIPHDGLDPNFLLYSLICNKRRMRPEIGMSAHGTKRIGTASITSFCIGIPSLGEQRTIASILAAVDQKIRAEEGRRAALDSLFKSLLHHLMTGKIRVGDADLLAAVGGTS